MCRAGLGVPYLAGSKGLIDTRVSVQGDQQEEEEEATKHDSNECALYFIECELYRTRFDSVGIAERIVSGCVLYHFEHLFPICSLQSLCLPCLN